MTTLTAESVVTTLSERAALHGGHFGDILMKTPVSMWDSPSELLAFWEGKDLSHIQSQSLFPEMAHDWDNIIPEDPSTNRARGAETMTEAEVDNALLDNVIDAEFIDAQFSDDTTEFAELMISYVI